MVLHFRQVAPTGVDWPDGPERLKRLKESLALIRELWEGDRVTFAGDFYRTDSATIYDKPDAPPPIYVAAAAPLVQERVQLLGEAVEMLAFLFTADADVATSEGALKGMPADLGAASEASAGPG